MFCVSKLRSNPPMLVMSAKNLKLVINVNLVFAFVKGLSKLMLNITGTVKRKVCGREGRTGYFISWSPGKVWTINVHV